MSDFPPLGTTAGGQAAGAFGLFDQNAGGVVGGGTMNEPVQTTTASGGDLFRADQTDLFGDDGSAAAGMLKNGGDGDVAAAEVVASAAPNVAGKTSTATPPPRPPPPATAVAAAANGAAPRALSPTVGVGGGVSHGRPAAASATVSAAAAGATNKSAFDDLNDSIRMALGGSPSRPAPMVHQQQSAVAAAQQQPLQQQQMPAATGMFGMNETAGQPMMTGAPIVGYGIPTQAQVPVGYGSPAKQPMSGDRNA